MTNAEKETEKKNQVFQELRKIQAELDSCRITYDRRISLVSKRNTLRKEAESIGLDLTYL